MTDRESLLICLDELVADIRSLDDEALREVVRYVERVIVAVWPEPDDCFEAVGHDGATRGPT